MTGKEMFVDRDLFDTHYADARFEFDDLIDSKNGYRCGKIFWIATESRMDIMSVD